MEGVCHFIFHGSNEIIGQASLRATRDRPRGDEGRTPKPETTIREHAHRHNLHVIARKIRRRFCNTLEGIFH
jgi:hypothetical protein